MRTLRMEEMVLYPICLKDVWMSELFFKYPEKKDIVANAEVAIEIHLSHKKRNEQEYIIRQVVSIECAVLGYQLSVTYDGFLASQENIPEDKVLAFIEVQTIRNLLPYAREAVVSTLVRAGLPPFVFPTVDTLQTISGSPKEETSIRMDNETGVKDKI